MIRTGHTLGWNSGDRIVSISGATTASYLYDYQGRRSSKTVGSATIYLYDGLNLIREAGASSADYLFGPGIDEPLAMSRGGQVYYYETDALGSVSTLTDSSATVQNAYLYDAWGQVRSQTGSLSNPFTYTSRETGEAGLNFYRARYYSSGIGRFLQEDPPYPRLAAALSERASPLYAYAGGDPVARTDALGLQAVGGPPTPTPIPGPCGAMPTSWTNEAASAADCAAMAMYLACNARQIKSGVRHGSGEEGEIACGLLGSLNEAAVNEWYRQCLNRVSGRRCGDVPHGYPNRPPRCRRGLPYQFPPGSITIQ